MKEPLYPDMPIYSDFQKSVIAFIDLQGFKKRTESIKDKSTFDHVAMVLFAAKKHFEMFKKISIITK